MREIKFRAWNKIFKVMGDVSVLEWYKNSSIFAYIRANNSVSGFQTDATTVDEIVLMQYTGLKDKNGEEIYEGDILKVIVGNKYEYMEVYFKDGCFGWGKEHNGIYSFDPLDLEDIEVIGNIYENKELLNENKK